MVADAAQETTGAPADPSARVGLPSARFALLRCGAEPAATEVCSGLSTRRRGLASRSTPKSIRYHFGSKQGLMLAFFDHIDEQALERQRAICKTWASLSARWFKACDFLDDDLSSGYVRILQDMIAAGWSDPEIAEAVRRNLARLVRPADGAGQGGRREVSGGLGPFSPAEVARLVGAAFLGARPCCCWDSRATIRPSGKPCAASAA